MRTCALAFAALLLLLLLATRAHGIRLDKQLHEAINSKEQQMGDPMSGAGEAYIAADSVKMRHCTPDGRCSAGKVERALAHADEPKKQQQVISSTGNGHSTTVINGRHEMEAASHPRLGGQQRPTYPDLMDIAGMDYSPAARKPPIHN